MLHTTEGVHNAAKLCCVYFEILWVKFKKHQ